jgi:hypothetical protein
VIAIGWKGEDDRRAVSGARWCIGVRSRCNASPERDGRARQHDTACAARTAFPRYGADQSPEAPRKAARRRPGPTSQPTAVGTHDANGDLCAAEVGAEHVREGSQRGGQLAARAIVSDDRERQFVDDALEWARLHDHAVDGGARAHDGFR